MVQESLQKSVDLLQEENDKLKAAIREYLGDDAIPVMETHETMHSEQMPVASSSQPMAAQFPPPPPHPTSGTSGNLHYNLVKALQTAQQNFTITDPTLPDNPIVYASHGFLALTGYSLDQVLGRNCRFLQGPHTDSRAIEILRNGIKNGYDTTTVLLNYRFDGTPFWNQLFIGPLKDSQGNVVNYLGVQCKVSEMYAEAFLKTPNSYTPTIQNQNLYESIMNPQGFRASPVEAAEVVSPHDVTNFATTNVSSVHDHSMMNAPLFSLDPTVTNQSQSSRDNNHSIEDTNAQTDSSDR